MFSDEEKSKLIAFGQDIDEKLQYQTKQIFRYRPPLPGFGEVKDNNYVRYDLGVTFSLVHLHKILENNPGSRMDQDVALILTNEIVMSLFRRILTILELETNIINAKCELSIINYAKVYEEPIILCSPEDLYRFQSHDDYVDSNLQGFCGPGEPYQVGTIDRILIFSNPVQLIHDKTIYVLTHPIIEYGISSERETICKYEVKDNDVEVTYNPVDIFYKAVQDTDNFKIFNINE